MGVLISQIAIPSCFIRHYTAIGRHQIGPRASFLTSCQIVLGRARFLIVQRATSPTFYLVWHDLTKSTSKFEFNEIHIDS